MNLYELVLTPADPKEENLYWYVVSKDLQEAIYSITLPEKYVLEQAKLIATVGNNLVLVS